MDRKPGDMPVTPDGLRSHDGPVRHMSVTAAAIWRSGPATGVCFPYYVMRVHRALSHAAPPHSSPKRIHRRWS